MRADPAQAQSQISTWGIGVSPEYPSSSDPGGGRFVLIAQNFAWALLLMSGPAIRSFFWTRRRDEIDCQRRDQHWRIVTYSVPKLARLRPLIVGWSRDA